MKGYNTPSSVRTMEHHSAMKRRKPYTCYSVNGPEHTAPSEGGIPSTGKAHNRQIQAESRSVVVGGWGEGSGGCFWGRGFSLLGTRS